MSKFEYKAEGELNSEYLLGLIDEYLDKLLTANDTNGIVEDDYKINVKSNRFVRWFKHKLNCIKYRFKDKSLMENYNKILSTKYINVVIDKINIFLQTNVLSAKQIFELNQTLEAINFEIVIPLIEEYRYKAIRTSQRQLLKVINDIKYLKNAKSKYILYNSPVNELKPFLSEKVSIHTIDYTELQKLVKHYVNLKYSELTTYNFEPYQPTFTTDNMEFYKDSITDNGVGQEVEEFIRSKMIEKLEIAKTEGVLPEDLQQKVEQIDILLKKLKLNKIEKMLQDLIKLKINLAHAKEVMDNCKETINSSTLSGKSQIFLIIDNLYYKLSKKCEVLEQKTKQKLQLVDKQKMFATLKTLQTIEKASQEEDVDEKEVFKSTSNNEIFTKKMQNNLMSGNLRGDIKVETKPSITDNLYDDDEINEIHITEDDGDAQAEEEIVIDDDKQN